MTGDTVAIDDIGRAAVSKAQGTTRTVKPRGEAPHNMKTVLFRPGNKWF